LFVFVGACVCAGVSGGQCLCGGIPAPTPASHPHTY